MQSQWKTFSIFALALGILFSAGPGYAKKNLDNAEELATIQKRIQDISSALNQKQARLSEEDSALRNIEKRISENEKRLRTLTQKSDASNKKLAKNKTAIKEANARLKSHIHNLYLQSKAFYIIQDQKELKLILGKDDPASIRRKLRYLTYIRNAHAKSIATYDATIKELNELNKKLGKENIIALRLKQQQEREQRVLNKNYKKRASVLSTLKKEISSRGQTLQSLKTREQEISKLLNQLSETLSDIPKDAIEQAPFASLKGKFSLPTKGKIVSSYRNKRLKADFLRNGIIIAAPKGQDVQAIHSGRVAYADWLRGFGLLLIIDHGDGYMTLYAHNQMLYKEIGDWVESGEAISSVGDSGGLDKPGLYFEIRKKGQPINPIKWVARKEINLATR